MSGRGRGKRKQPEEAAAAEGAEGEKKEEKTATPPATKRVTRSRTMAATAKEGSEFLVEEGSKDLVNPRGNQRETRSRHKAREALTTILSDKPASADEIAKGFDEKKFREELRLVFRVFDRDQDGHISEVEIADIMRSMGKRPLKAKIRALVQAADANKNGKIEESEFVNYMVARKKAKLEKKGGENPASPKAEAAPVAAVAASAPAVAAAAAAAAPPKLQRGPSIFNFYNVPAAAAPAPAAEANPAGSQFDLGADKVFQDYKILVYIGAYADLAKEHIPPILEKKGFQYELTTDILEFLGKLEDSDETWIISGPSPPGKGYNPVQDWSKISAKDFSDKIIAYYRSGRGVALFAEDEPLTAEANSVLSALENIKLVGNTPGGKVLNAGEQPGFRVHLLTTGLQKMFEGNTVCHPEADNVGSLQILATSSDGHPLILFKDYTAPGGFNPQAQAHGRLLVDCSYTKLWQMESAGRERYFQNLAVWLLGLESRLSIDFPPTRKAQPVQKYVWQYYAGGWYNYDQAASDVVEAAYQDYLQNPGACDVRAIQSGRWRYQVDFLNNKQTNVEHESHTVRNIRRVPAALSVH